MNILSQRKPEDNPGEETKLKHKIGDIGAERKTTVGSRPTGRHTLGVLNWNKWEINGQALLELNSEREHGSVLWLSVRQVSQSQRTKHVAWLHLGCGSRVRALRGRGQGGEKVFRQNLKTDTRKLSHRLFGRWFHTGGVLNMILLLPFIHLLIFGRVTVAFVVIIGIKIRPVFCDMGLCFSTWIRFLLQQAILCLII